MQSVGTMSVPRRKVLLLCLLMGFNIFICVLMGLSWKFRGEKGNKKIKIPERFWSQQVLSESFWNKEQQRLDFINNPLLSAVLANDSFEAQLDWLHDSGPHDPCKPDWRVATRISDYNILPRRFKDFLLHMRCRSYPILISQTHVCDQKPFLLLVVKSLIPHFDRRQAIRKTWGRAGVYANRNVAIVFLLGNTIPGDDLPDLQEMLYHEAKIHRDLLQWDYRDTFFNLTLKEVLFLEWFNKHCPQAQYVFKGDDDVFVNTLRILYFLEGLSEDKAKDLFIGDVISNAGPHRDQKLKYFIPKSVYVGGYPPYAGGGGYLFSGSLALQLYNVSQRVVLYPIDDVYTGMCLKKLGHVPEKHDGFKTFDIDEKYRSNPCVYRTLMVVHSRTPQEMLKIWPWIIHPELDCLWTHPIPPLLTFLPIFSGICSMFKPMCLIPDNLLLYLFHLVLFWLVLCEGLTCIPGLKSELFCNLFFYIFTSNLVVFTIQTFLFKSKWLLVSQFLLNLPQITSNDAILLPPAGFKQLFFIFLF